MTDENIMIYISYIPKSLDGIPIAGFSLSDHKGKVIRDSKCIVEIVNNQDKK